jgi:hypothetical protein
LAGAGGEEAGAGGSSRRQEQAAAAGKTFSISHLRFFICHLQDLQIQSVIYRIYRFNWKLNWPILTNDK